MKASIITDNGGLLWTDVSEPALRDGEVLVEVYAAGVNRADLMQRAGQYPPPKDCPEWPGLEISGVIKELSPMAAKESNWHVGDRVCALLGGGGYAEYAAVPYNMLMPIPKGISMEEAAAMPEAFATAYLNLFIEGGAKEGMTLLMQAGSSGLASVVIPMAKAFGLRVITTVRGAKKAEAISNLGADVIVDTLTESLEDVLKREEETGHPLNIAIDCLGGENVAKCFPYCAYGCRWIMIATLAGDISPVNMRTMYVKNIRLIGSTLRSKPVSFKGKLLSDMVKNIWQKVESGEIRAKIFKILPIEQAEEGHSLLENSKSTGKVVLTLK